jgi:hypothetical protein
MQKTFQYRLYPTNQQHRLLNEQLEERLCACFHQMAASGDSTDSADSDLAAARHPHCSERPLGEKTTS